MSIATTIIRITERAALIKSFEIMKELRTDLTLESYLELYEVMEQEGYELYALYNDREIQALAGVAIKTNFYNKKHLWVYDLVTSSASRSSGYGKELMLFLSDYASENNCVYIALESGLQRLDAHRFYEGKFAFEKFCYSFRKSL
ncbi:GNAT family N-acetyltransferase [Ureibacillus chungkukjangi]|uniref:Acetyltransferase (GNAT) family protein n=1 Tax=Ureibacillus chungkukjangi TaxID=1202712 RepID=A0A318TLE1_9BACL|nr:GNAT family N-acetyltransferase [Ureibacillus chungkukjangi]MCM3387862.1 GNAT family N-acetyltransferase [Ureibacillus chungkukjangi]PYF05662.1 acetyltransferase (GNAT) family protein [Ureibacillus chungkukjangi]